MPRDAPLLSAGGIALALSLGVLLCWPMLLVGGPLIFFDTIHYLRDGAKVGQLAAELLPLPDGGAAQPAAGAAGGDSAGAGSAAVAERDGGGVTQLRSSTYAFFMYLSSRPGWGLVGTVVLQTAATLLTLFALVPRAALDRPWRAVAATLLLGTVTTLPWHASYTMPDILAAAILLYYAALAERIDRIGPAWRIALLGIATFAVSAHYGYIPLAAGLAVVVLVLRLWRRQLGAGIVALALLPVVLTAAVNMAGSKAVVGEASIAPKRLPILLARSIEDGPAYDYLHDACPGADLAICEIIPDIPDTIQDFLFSSDGIYGRSAEDFDRIRAEEARILWRAFLAYPMRQTEALAGNALRQAVAVGTGDLFPPDSLDLSSRTLMWVLKEKRAEYRGVLSTFETVTQVATFAGGVLLFVLWATGRVSRSEGRILVVVAAGVVGNALIFGGLSAPVDRYQSRLIWILPALALLVWMRPPRRDRSPRTALTR